MYYAKASYCDTSDLNNWNCGQICDKVKGVSTATRVENYLLGVFGYVTYNSIDNIIIASFRGSSKIMNWIMNINFVKSYYKSRIYSRKQVHTGFYESYRSIDSQVVS